MNYSKYYNFYINYFKYFDVNYKYFIIKNIIRKLNNNIWKFIFSNILIFIKKIYINNCIEFYK